ncbi:hypothetical protein KM043_001207 [Ampulex compressa]|nr:hypothetical protein KM043_001207 [Ampulex compressa]
MIGEVKIAGLQKLLRNLREPPARGSRKGPRFYRLKLPGKSTPRSTCAFFFPPPPLQALSQGLLGLSWHVALLARWFVCSVRRARASAMEPRSGWPEERFRETQLGLARGQGRRSWIEATLCFLAIGELA